MKQILEALVLLINEGGSLLSDRGTNYYLCSQKIERWKHRVNVFLKENISTEVAANFNNESREQISLGLGLNETLHFSLSLGKSFLESIKDDIEQNPEFWVSRFSKSKKNQSQLEMNSIDIVRKICSRFHIVAKQLKDHRHEDRDTITIKDEYDVQDLLHALLKIFFDDIRPEECTPSYAGGSSRIDFLIKSKKMAIEVKKTRKGLKQKEIADQLIIDIDRYKATHPDCETLFCFVYDPEGLIQNPTGFEKDINKKHKGFAEVLICPKGL